MADLVVNCESYHLLVKGFFVIYLFFSASFSSVVGSPQLGQNLSEIWSGAPHWKQVMPKGVGSGIDIVVVPTIDGGGAVVGKDAKNRAFDARASLTFLGDLTKT